jgi:regulator of sigma E protease
VVWNIVIVIIVFSVLIFIHELGHLLACKASHIKVEKFSLGFGPALVKWRWSETTYSISALPLGGYIKMEGEDIGDTGFFAESLGKKVLVLVTGPAFNLILGFVLMAILFAVFGMRVPEPRIAPLAGSFADSAGLRKGDLVLSLNRDTIRSFYELDSLLLKPESARMDFRVRRGDRIVSVTAFGIPESIGIDPFYRPIAGTVKGGSPAAHAGIRPGDEIVQIDTTHIAEWSDLTEIVRTSADRELALKIVRGGETIATTVTPRVGSDLSTGEKVAQIGIKPSVPTVKIPLSTAVWEAFKRTGLIVVKTFVILWELITGKISGQAVSGPVMVAKIAYEGAEWGAEMLLALWAMLAINLFVINMLPVPFLDGGRAYLFIFESIRRKKLTARQWDLALRIGLYLVVLLVIFALSNDFLNVTNVSGKSASVGKKIQLGLVIAFSVYAVIDLIQSQRAAKKPADADQKPPDPTPPPGTGP